MIPIVGFALLVLAFPAVYALAKQWQEAGLEEHRWERARLELGEGALDLVAFDTRVLRPWGPSAACELFAEKARAAGQDWLEPAVLPFHHDAPRDVRAIVGELEGAHVAWICARTRRRGIVTKYAARLANGRVIESFTPPRGAPPEELVSQLEQLVRTASAG